MSCANPEPTPDKPEYWQRAVPVGNNCFIYELDRDKVAEFMAELWKEREQKRKAEASVRKLS